MKHKTNPRRRPATMADVERAKRAAQADAVRTAWAIFFTVLRDKEQATVDDLKRVWGEVEDLSDSIARGYVNVTDLRDALRREANITID